MTERSEVVGWFGRSPQRVSSLLDRDGRRCRPGGAEGFEETA